MKRRPRIRTSDRKKEAPENDGPVESFPGRPINDGTYPAEIFHNNRVLKHDFQAPAHSKEAYPSRIRREENLGLASVLNADHSKSHGLQSIRKTHIIKANSMARRLRRRDRNSAIQPWTPTQTEAVGKPESAGQDKNQ